MAGAIVGAAIYLSRIPMDYQPNRTALLLVDPYNDFISEGGKVFDGVRQVLADQDMIAHLRAIVAAVRAAGIVLIFVPHHRAEAHDYRGWKYPTPRVEFAHKIQAFAKDSWGGTFHPDFQPQPGDIVAQEHFGSSGFTHTDLNLHLKQLGIEKLILAGMLANTCIETTGKAGAELGYHITLVTDATGAFNHAELHYAHHINGPTYASHITTTAGLLADLAAATPQ
jgi:nicotinamidase-related amidase